MNAFLTLRGLRFAWPGQPTLFPSLDASVGPGLGLVSGDEQSGKTTLMRLLAGELPPEVGSITLAGRAVSARWAGFRPDMAGPDLDAVVVADWLRAQMPEGPARDRLDDHIDGLSLDEHLHKSFHMLSAGGRRKVGLAAAMALQPPLALLDQPFAALDLASIRYLTGWLAQEAAASDRLVLIADYGAPAGLAIDQRIDLG